VKLNYDDQGSDVLFRDKTAAAVTRIISMKQLGWFDPCHFGNAVNLVPVLLPFQEG
jgi:hypothetical protein